MNPSCECGCGGEVSKKGNRFIVGHNGNGWVKGKRFSHTHKNNISVALMGHTGYWRGKKKNPETNEKVRKALIGHKVSMETREKISEKNKRHKPSLETRRKMSLAKKGKKLSEKQHKFLLGHIPWNKGRSTGRKGIPLSETHRRHISESNTGKRHSAETREKISKALGRMSWNKGKSLSVETRKKISVSLSGKCRSEESRKKMRLAHLRRIRNQLKEGQPLRPCIGLFERSCLDFLEANCEKVIQRQKQVCGYFLDGYIRELNLAIEFDEISHERTERKERDRFREENIQKELGCKFFRIQQLRWQNDPTSVVESFKSCLSVMKLRLRIA